MHTFDIKCRKLMTMPKTVPLSVRVSMEDADFIAQLNIEGAVTPSDKIRAIIANARLRQSEDQNYEVALHNARDQLASLNDAVGRLELEDQKHSELLALFTNWLSEAFAFVLSARHRLLNNLMTLEQFEHGISERTFRLIEAVARMGVTSQAPCYEKGIVRQGFNPLIELLDMIIEKLEKDTDNG